MSWGCSEQKEWLEDLIAEALAKLEAGDTEEAIRTLKQAFVVETS